MDECNVSMIVSPDFDAYTSGKIEAHQIRCALCQTAPCKCPVFGTPEYFEWFNERHGRH